MSFKINLIEGKIIQGKNQNKIVIFLTNASQ